MNRQLRARIVAGGAGLVVVAGLGACAIRAGGPPGEFTYVVGSMRQNGAAALGIGGAQTAPAQSAPAQSAAESLAPAGPGEGQVGGPTPGVRNSTTQLTWATGATGATDGGMLEPTGTGGAPGSPGIPSLAPGVTTGTTSHLAPSGAEAPATDVEPSSVSGEPQNATLDDPAAAAPATIVAAGGEPATPRTTVGAPTSSNGIGGGGGTADRGGGSPANVPATTVTNPSTDSAPVTSKTPASGPDLRNPAPAGAPGVPPLSNPPLGNTGGSGNGKEAAPAAPASTLPIDPPAEPFFSGLTGKNDVSDLGASGYDPAATPELSSIALFGSGAVGMGSYLLARLRRRR